MDEFLSAIVDDDLARVAEMLASDSTLAQRQLQKDVRYHSGIFHWMYVGDTGLHLAAAGYRTKIIPLLIVAGADPNSTGNRRRSGPLQYAADGYITGPAWNPAIQVETLQILLDAGADLHGQDQNGATALHRAVRTRCAAAVAFLLSAGSDPRQRNKSGSTPFHLAVQNTGRGGSGEQAAKAAQRQIIEEFIARGISPRLEDCNGRSVADCAKSAWVRELLARDAA
jgi:hypothetical protein